jgi:imidazolonepropionase-like amidohydrolase
MMIDRRTDARPSVRVQERRRDEALKTIREVFRRAAAYRTARSAQGRPGIPPHDEVAALGALVPVLDGRIPLLVRAEKKPQMEAAIRFVDEELKGNGIRLAFLGAHDAPKLAEKLAERKIPVILDGVLRLPFREDEPYDESYTLAGALAKAGVTVAITNGAAPFAAARTRDLPNHAAMAAAFGLPPLEALRAITLNPATIFGVDDRIGSLAAGKDASIAVWTGDPLQITSNVVALYDKGEPLDLSDRHKRLWKRYRNRPKAAPPVK